MEGRFSYILGVLVSVFLHLVLGVISIVMLENSAAKASKVPEVFTVTLEGGKSLGGVTRVPKKGKEKALPTKSDVPVEKASAKKVKAEEKLPEKKLEKPSVVEDPAIKLAEEKKKAEAKKEAEQKKQAEKKKAEAKKAEQKKKDDAEAAAKKAAAKKAAAAKKRLADKRRKEKEREDRDQRLADIAERMKENYKGESVNAGGSGFGAARIGGSGMGGGTLAAAEKIAYADELQRHVKAGWRWLEGSTKLRALVIVRILPEGNVQGVRIEQSSGNANFDDSVIRAVKKADPVPPPPTKYYRDFSSVRFWFDSHEQ